MLKAKWGHKYALIRNPTSSSIFGGVCKLELF